MLGGGRIAVRGLDSVDESHDPAEFYCLVFVVCQVVESLLRISTPFQTVKAQSQIGAAAAKQLFDVP